MCHYTQEQIYAAEKLLKYGKIRTVGVNEYLVKDPGKKRVYQVYIEPKGIIHCDCIRKKVRGEDCHHMLAAAIFKRRNMRDSYIRK